MSDYFLVFKGADTVDNAGNIAIPVTAGVGDAIVSLIVLVADPALTQFPVGTNMAGFFQPTVQHVSPGSPPPLNFQFNGALMGGVTFINQNGPLSVRLDSITFLALMRTAGG
jgi:hypothetical protein